MILHIYKKARVITKKTDFQSDIKRFSDSEVELFNNIKCQPTGGSLDSMTADTTDGDSDQACSPCDMCDCGDGD